MPKHSRSANSHRYSAMPMTITPASMYTQPRMTLTSPTSYYGLDSTSAVDLDAPLTLPPHTHHPAATFDSYYATIPTPTTATIPMPSLTTTTAPAVAGPAASHHRPSNGAWSPEDDEQLIQARMRGLNWAQIKDTYFPSKTGNACRKRHERLMDRKGVDDWDLVRTQQLAKDYMSLRREIWAPLAARTGEKWQVVEQKCFAQGIKNLQSASRSGNRRSRMESNAAASLPGYDDDSGISGMTLTPVDELDAPYSSPEANGSPPGLHPVTAPAGYAPHHHHVHHHAQQHHSHQHHHVAHQHHHHQQQHQLVQAHLQPLGQGYAMYGDGPGYHGYSSSVSSNASNNYHPNSQGSSPYMQGQRQPSVDMGIEAIIHRPGRHSQGTR